MKQQFLFFKKETTLNPSFFEKETAGFALIEMTDLRRLWRHHDLFLPAPLAHLLRLSLGIFLGLLLILLALSNTDILIDPIKLPRSTRVGKDTPSSESGGACP
jgi:hypothetical protein